MSADALQALRVTAAGCTACRLAATRTNVVFGAGSATAALMFIGEGPGEQEDLSGQPFVGRAGKLLTQLIEEIGLTREQVYIANVVKCRPPGNRDPQADEIESCRGYLAQQLKIVEPKVIVTLGNFATKWLLSTKVGITKLRGIPTEVEGRTVVPMLHPSAILRNGGGMPLANTRADFILVKRLISTP